MTFPRWRSNLQNASLRQTLLLPRLPLKHFSSPVNASDTNYVIHFKDQKTRTDTAPPTSPPPLWSPRRHREPGIETGRYHAYFGKTAGIKRGERTPKMKDGGCEESKIIKCKGMEMRRDDYQRLCCLHPWKGQIYLCKLMDLEQSQLHTHMGVCE